MSSTGKTSAAFNDLKTALGSRPPAELDRLKAADLKDLAARINDTADRHEASLREAEQRVIEDQARAQVEKICKDLLANTVIENYAYELVP